MNRAFSTIIIILIFVLAGVLFFHSLTSINADIGRHIKLGEIIWQLKEVPKTNLLSFTAPDHPFINHHWLSEVIFYGTYSLGSGWLSGLRVVMALKIIVLLATYLLLFLIVKKHNIFSVVLAFLVSIFVFAARTEPRPEIFSYLIFAAYLFIIYRARENIISNFEFRISNFKINSLWFLPILQVFWVNMHIYFIIGPILFLFFLIDKVVNSRLKFLNFIQNSKLEILTFFLIILANFANPNFIKGALYPFTVLNEYGYSVAENSSLFFLAKYFGQWSPQDKLYLISLFVLAGSFIAWFWKRRDPVDKRQSSPGVGDAPLREHGVSFIHRAKARTFDLLLIAMTVALSFKMQRSIPLFALAIWPVMANNLAGITNYELRITNFVKKWFYACAIFVLITSIYFVVSNRFYNRLDSAKTFGWGISSAAQDGTDFIKANDIRGPVFNNFDIGSYLVWQLYPEQKVFVDGRPEAYPVEFFENVYKPMQRDENTWNEMSEKYGINYIFFVHTDATEWGEEFLTGINKDPEWPMVFLNDAVVIFLKDENINRPLIGKYKLTENNVNEKISQVLDKLDRNDINAFVNFANALYRFRYLAGSARVFEELIKNQPASHYGYQGAGYAYVTMNDPATQEKAAKNLQKAIDLGSKTFNNYFTLGIINANLGNFFAAEENIKKALEINPDNQNVRQALEVIRKTQRIKL